MPIICVDTTSWLASFETIATTYEAIALHLVNNWGDNNAPFLVVAPAITTVVVTTCIGALLLATCGCWINARRRRCRRSDDEFVARYLRGHGGHGCCIPTTDSCFVEEPITVFVARTVVTMDPSWPEASAVACRGGKILSVGSLETLSPWLDEAGGDVIVDRSFAEHVLVPGFIDPHVHPLIGGIAMTLPCVAFFDTPNPDGPPTKGLKTKAAVIARLKEYIDTDADTTPAVGEKKEVFAAWGYDSVGCGGHLDRGDLDAVSETRAVACWDCSMHYVYTNTALLRLVGLTAGCRAVRGVNGIGIGADGELNGQFLAIDAAMLVMKPIVKQKAEPKVALACMKHVVELARRGGITTLAEMMLGGVHLAMEERLFKHFFNDRRCPMRCVVVADARKQVAKAWGNPDRAAANVRALAVTETTEKLIYNSGIKFFTDDAFLGLTMQMNAPGYIDPARNKGIWNNAPGRQYFDKVAPFWRSGCRIHVHSNGDGGQDSTLAVLAALQQDHPRFDHRFTIEHYGVSTQAISRRLKSLGGCASVNAYYPHLRGELNEKHVGVDRAHLASRLGTLVRLGVPTAMHTDTPVAPPRPLEEIWVAVTRKGALTGKPLAPAERVDRLAALRMKTVDAAYVIGMDDVIGSIEAGKRADFTVLEDNPLTVENVDDIPNIKIWGTVLGGEKIPHERRWELESQAPPGLFGGLLWLQAETRRPGSWSAALWRRILRLATALGFVAAIVPGGTADAADICVAADPAARFDPSAFTTPFVDPGGCEGGDHLAPFRAAGANIYDLLWDAWESDDTGGDINTSLATLEHYAEQNLTFYRTFASPWSGKSVARLWVDADGEEREAYWSTMDTFVDRSRQLGVYMQPSLFVAIEQWALAVNATLRALVTGEGDEGERANAILKEYATAMVARYLSEPSILMWGLGNELNLVADGCDEERSKENYFNTSEMLEFVSRAVGWIREVDPLRPINGDFSEPRSSAMHIMTTPGGCNSSTGDQWQMDSRDEFMEVLSLYHNSTTSLALPDVVGIHTYSCGHYPLEFTFCEVDNSMAVINASSEVARDLGLPFIVGEYGSSDASGSGAGTVTAGWGWPVAEGSTRLDYPTAILELQAAAAGEGGAAEVQLSLAWSWCTTLSHDPEGVMCMDTAENASFAHFADLMTAANGAVAKR